MSLNHPAAFFAEIRARRLLGATLEQSEVDGLNAILDACEGWGVSWTAYALATAWHETAHTLQPIREIGSDAYLTRMYDPLGLRPAVAARLGNEMPGDGAEYCGRGYVQITGRANYLRAGQELGVDLIHMPDAAMQPSVAARILRRGMEEGWFSERDLLDYLPPTNVDAERKEFVDARAIVNGSDDAAHIADAALAFQTALHAGGWTVPFVPRPLQA